MSFIISGDIHGTLDIGKLVKFFQEHEEDYSMVYSSPSKTIVFAVSS